MKITVREHEGRVYAVYSMFLTNEPIRRSLWWELDCYPGTVREGATGDYDSTRRGFWVESDRPGESTRLLFARNRDRDAQAERIVEDPVDPPRTKLETRWRDGRWERLTKKGWK